MASFRSYCQTAQERLALVNSRLGASHASGASQDVLGSAIKKGFFNNRKTTTPPAAVDSSLPQNDSSSENLAKALFNSLDKSSTAALYEDVEKRMEEPRKKIAQEKQTMELERNLFNIVTHDRPEEKKAADAEEYLEHKKERWMKQEDQLECKRKVLEKIKTEKQW